MSMVDIKDIQMRLRDRTPASATDPVDWRKVLAADVNARLLSLIVSRKPASISELTQLSGRAQPNVSRSLATLVRAGLVELRQNKRTSIPMATPFGLEKAAAFEIVVEEEPKPAVGAEGDRLISVEIEGAEDLPDRVDGLLNVRIPVRGRQTAICHRRGDLTKLAERLSSDWFRILYRREAYHLADVEVVQGEAAYRASLDVQSKGGQMELRVHTPSDDGEKPSLLRFLIASRNFENAFTDGLFAPVASELVRRGEIDRPLHGNIAHLADIAESSRDLVYWRTAGALGLGLGDDVGDMVQELINEFPEEEARLEFASAVLPESLAGATEWIEREMNAHGERNRLTKLEAYALECRNSYLAVGAKPHRRGIALAKKVRELLRLQPDEALGGLTGLADAMGAPDYVSGATTALAGEVRGFRSDDPEGPSVVIDGSHGSLSETFLLARGIGDYLAYGGQKAAITDVYTDRQRVGRAFAAELIAPSSAVVAMINDGQPRQRVAQHFGATSVMIGHQFENNVDLVAG